MPRADKKFRKRKTMDERFSYDDRENKGTSIDFQLIASHTLCAIWKFFDFLFYVLDRNIHFRIPFECKSHFMDAIHGE